MRSFECKRKNEERNEMKSFIGEGQREREGERVKEKVKERAKEREREWERERERESGMMRLASVNLKTGQVPTSAKDIYNKPFYLIHTWEL